MIQTGDAYLCNADTRGLFKTIPEFRNHRVKLIAAGWSRILCIAEPVQLVDGPRPQQVLACLEDTSEGMDLYEVPDLDPGEEIRQVAFGGSHALVLTNSGRLHSCGECHYGSLGHGGNKSVTTATLIPALRDRPVKFVAAGPRISLAITENGDVYTWGESLRGELGQFSPLEVVPKFAPLLSRLRVMQVAFGNEHAVACTEGRTCVTWGDNSAGQIGNGHKSVRSYKPYEVEGLDLVVSVAAGWGHCAAITGEGDLYTWGLNSHGQLGLGDTDARYTPQCVRGVGGGEVKQVSCGQAMTIVRTSEEIPYIMGKLPAYAKDKQPPVARDAYGLALEPTELPRRVGEDDPDGCALGPLALPLPLPSPSIATVVASNKAILAFARSAVYKVAPKLAPLEGGTALRMYATGLPHQQLSRQEANPSQWPDGEPPRLIQDMVAVHVRMKAQDPVFDVTVEGRIVDVDPGCGDGRIVECLTPDLTLSPLAPVLALRQVCLRVQITIDGGLTWTEEREDASFEYCKYPQAASHVVPNAAPCDPGTEILIHMQIPPEIPAHDLTVKFHCEPTSTLGNAEDDGDAPTVEDLQGAYHDGNLEDLPVAGPLEMLVAATVDPGGNGVRCSVPPFNKKTFHLYNVTTQVSLDGQRYTAKALPFLIYNVNVVQVVPNLGPLDQKTKVEVVAEGLVKTSVQKARIDFPWEQREVPATYDHTTHSIRFTIRGLEDKIHALQAERDAAAAALRAAEPPPVQEEAPEGEEGAPAEGAGGEAAAAEEEDEAEEVDKFCGLSGLTVPVEISLNGKSFTSDMKTFTFYGEVSSDKVSFPPPAAEGAEQLTVEHILKQDTVFMVHVEGLLPTQYAKVRFKWLKETCADPTKPGEEDFLPEKEWFTLDLDEKDVNLEAGTLKAVVPPGPLKQPERDDILTILEFSMNGQHFHPVELPAPLKIAPYVDPNAPVEEIDPKAKAKGKKK